MRSSARTPVVIALCAVAVPLALGGCSGQPAAPSGSVVKLAVSSADFVGGATIPERFTCKGAGQFPSIAWKDDTGRSTAFAVIVDDPDAPGGTYYHEVALDLPASATKLTNPFTKDATIALNSDGSVGWTPPCPPSGTHHYRFTVYGLSAATGLTADATADEALAAIQKVRVAQGRLTGLVSS